MILNHENVVHKLVSEFETENLCVGSLRNLIDGVEIKIVECLTISKLNLDSASLILSV